MCTKGCLLIFGVIILYKFGVLQPVLLAFICSAIIAAVHACERPIVNESFYIHQQTLINKAQVEQQKRFVGQSGETDDEMVFTSQIDISDQKNQALRNRKT